MAMKIAATPILTGKEAEDFEKKAEANKKKYASKNEVLRMIRSFKKFKWVTTGA